MWYPMDLPHIDFDALFVSTSRQLTSGVSQIAEYTIRGAGSSENIAMSAECAQLLGELPSKFIVKRSKITDDPYDEIKVMRYLAERGFSHCATYYGAAQCGDEICLFIESLSGLDLFELMESHDNDQCVITTTHRYEIAVELASMIHELHSHGVIHRDIKLENIMIQMPDDTDTDDANVRIWLIDYGFSYIIGEDMNKPMAGTSGYVDPWQAMLFRGHGPQDIDLIRGDWWAFGQIVVPLLTNVQLYNYHTKTYLMPTMEALEMVPACLRATLRQLTAPYVTPYLRPSGSTIVERLQEAFAQVLDVDLTTTPVVESDE